MTLELAEEQEEFQSELSDYLFIDKEDITSTQRKIAVTGAGQVVTVIRFKYRGETMICELYDSCECEDEKVQCEKEWYRFTWAPLRREKHFQERLHDPNDHEFHDEQRKRDPKWTNKRPWRHRYPRLAMFLMTLALNLGCLWCYRKIKQDRD